MVKKNIKNISRLAKPTFNNQTFLEVKKILKSGNLVQGKKVAEFEKKLNIEGEITKSFEKYPYTQTYDCSSNFAPITLFNYEEMINFKWKRELNERVR